MLQQPARPAVNGGHLGGEGADELGDQPLAQLPVSWATQPAAKAAVDIQPQPAQALLVNHGRLQQVGRLDVPAASRKPHTHARTQPASGWSVPPANDKAVTSSSLALRVGPA